MSRITEVTNLANELIQKHIPEYHLKFLKSRNKAGHCSYVRKEIGISRFHAENSTIEFITDTILHEIAHALAGPRTGHGPIWRQKCREVGANPKTRYDSSEMDLGHKWEIHCQCPGVVRKKQQKPNPAVWQGRKSCRGCRTGAPGKPEWVFKEAGKDAAVTLEAKPVPVRRRRRRSRYSFNDSIWGF